MAQTSMLVDPRLATAGNETGPLLIERWPGASLPGQANCPRPGGGQGTRTAKTGSNRP